MFDFSYETQAFFIDAASGWVGFAANWFLQSTILISIGLLVGWILKARGSAVQSVVYRTTLLAIFACPLATLALSASGFTGWSIDMPLAWERSEIVETADDLEAPEVAALPEVDSARVQGNSEPTPFGAEFQPDPFDTFESENAGQTQLVDSNTSIPTDRLAPATPILTPEVSQATAENAISIQAFGLVAITASLIWLAVALFFSQRLCSAWHSLRRLIRNSTPVDNQILTECDRLAKQINVATPRLLRSPFLPSPCLAGIRRPTILMPAEDSKLSIQDLLIHELAHLRRKDCHWNLLRQIATAVFFFQPLVWILSRRIEVTAEEVCDDFVVQFGGDRGDYAKRLVDIAELSSAPIAPVGVGVVALRSMLSSRVSRILDTSREISTRASRLLLMSVLGCGILGTAMTGLLGLQSEDSSVNPETDVVVMSDEETRTSPHFKGSVIDPAGRPVPDAKIYLLFGFRTKASGLLAPDAQPIARTDQNGRFEFSVDESVPGHENFKVGNIAAVKDGFGVGWCSSIVFDVDDQSRKDYQERMDMNGVSEDSRNMMQHTLDRVGQPLQLVRDAQAVTGTIMDIEGQPVAGAKLTLLQILTGVNDTLNEWHLAAAEPTADFYSTHRKTLNYINGPQVRSLVKPAVTNAAGKFQLSGVGDNRIVELLVEGPGIATETIYARTEKGKTIGLMRVRRVPRQGSDNYYSNEFTYIAAPTAEISGTVRDQQTSKPIAGATIKSQSRHGEARSGWGQDFVRTVTDNEGHFRLNGMPIGEDNRIAVLPPAGDIAYLSVGFDTPLSSPNSALKLDIELNRGVWLEGVAIDKRSGEGLPGAVSHHVLKGSPNYKLAASMNVEKIDQSLVGDDGKFRLAVPPGPAYVTFLSYSRKKEYSRSKFIKQLDGSLKEAEKQIYNTSPFSMLPVNSNAIVAVDFPEGKAAEIKFELDEGEKLSGTAFDSTGKQIKHFSYTGLLHDFEGVWSFSSNGKLKVVDYDQNAVRKICLLSKDRKYAGYVQLTGEQESDFSVKLKRSGKVKGRLLDDEGQPLTNCELTNWKPSFSGSEFDPNKSDSPPLPPNLPRSRNPYYVTDSAGRFEIDGLVAGLEYRILATRVKDLNTPPDLNRLIDKTIKVEPGESKDFGNVTIVSQKRMEELQTKAKPSKRSNASQDESTTIRTTVLLPDGSVAEATHVALLGYSRELKQDTVFASGTTSKTGECTLTSNVKFGSAESDKFLVARKDGLAIGWKLVTPSDLESADPITVNLHEAGVIKGRLIDIEGQPAVGEKLQVKLVFNPDAERESIGANVSFYSTIEKLKNNTPQAWIQPVITDQEGRFELIGVPKGFGVYATLYDSEKFAPQGIALNTGQPEQRKQSDRTYRSLVKNVKPSEETVFTLPPAKVITGKITYEDTGEPVPNTKISIWASQEEFGSMSPISGTTDADGKYRMLPKPGIRFGVSAFPPSGTAYMGREAETLVWENADTKRNVDIKLPRVTLVKGRVIEKGTGKPVDDATITFEGSSKNAPKNVITGWQATQKTNAEGKFTFAVPQGHGTLTVRKMNSPYVLQTMDSRKMISDKPGGSRFYANAFHKMKIEKGTDAIEAEIEVLPGKTVRGVIVDQDGNSVEEVNIVTRLKSWDLAGSWRGDERPTIGGKFELKGLAPDETYKVHFLAPRQKLGATVELKATDQDVRVVLQPCGSAKAKFVATDEEDRTRLKRMTPFLYFVLNPGVPKYDFDSQRLGKLAADIDFNANLDRVNYGHDAFEKGAGPKFDDDLRVTYSALIPGATYRMPTTFDQHLSYEEFVAKPGETLDLGEFTPKFGQ